MSLAPKVYQEFLDAWADSSRRQSYLEAYQTGRQTFVPHLLPELAVTLSAQETLDILRCRLGSTLDLALDPAHTDPDSSVELPAPLRSPVADLPDGSWLKRSNMVGINVRTVGSFWNIIKYALTLPAAQDSIHLLPIWEPGVVGSLYGISSWQLNPEFFSAEVAEAVPGLDTIEKQLRAVVNLLHATGRTVGMDVIPHTDRFSQIVLSHPEYFEWLQRQETEIVDHSANLHEAVQDKIVDFLQAHGSAVSGEPIPLQRSELFSETVGEAERLRLLFGRPEERSLRETRRNQLVFHLVRYGFEPVPATMAPPYRGLKVDPRPEAKTVDANGLVWRDYVIAEPQSMSRVFGPLARYKLYESRDDNRHWALDFEQPRVEVWDYVCRHYAEAQQRYGFDFMRGDMSHVQMRPGGVPDNLDRYYDILGAVKLYIQARVPSFGYFAETFLPPRDIITYGEELDHLEASEADTTLGDLQSVPVNNPVFLQRLRQYDDLRRTRLCTPNFTVMTADKDDPRFDEFYLAGNELRLFLAFFLTDLPSYMGLGFEVRDLHFSPAPNEHYTKLYVFQESAGPKATHGPYRWGQNGHLFAQVTRLKQYLDSIWPQIKARPLRWLLPPDPTANTKVIAWTFVTEPNFVFMANTDTANPVPYFGLPAVPGLAPEHYWACEFSTVGHVAEMDQLLRFNGKHYRVEALSPGEGRVYRLSEQT
ncbi:MAG TPA: hypothetical protein PKD98_23170 [Anaerolineae bacterium]|nr:hypothetical protein [Anaerolineae bacterium]